MISAPKYFAYFHRSIFLTFRRIICIQLKFLTGFEERSLEMRAGSDDEGPTFQHVKRVLCQMTEFVDKRAESLS